MKLSFANEFSRAKDVISTAPWFDRRGLFLKAEMYHLKVNLTVNTSRYPGFCVVLINIQQHLTESEENYGQLQQRQHVLNGIWYRKLRI